MKQWSHTNGVHSPTLLPPYLARKPVLNYETRVATIKMSEFADEVIEAPLIPTLAFLELHQIDFITHGSDWTEQSVEHYYGEPKRAGKLKIIPHTPGICTTQIIREVALRKDLWENLAPVASVSAGVASTEST
jgi:glycerol-3-phosphate cytidylyltransferase-like family protein